MIRRNITLDDGTAGWLLISQVEHARMSGETATAWHDSFSHEVVEAITHHDDGWARWECAPRLDPLRGRPLSFIEMNVADALEIWSDSIAAARRFGPLAGAIVAGHFIGLGTGAGQAAKSPAQDWLREMEIRRSDWLAEWQSISPDHTLGSAVLCQRMLLTADLLSLWLCCDGPIVGDDAAALPNTEFESRSATILGEFHFQTHDEIASNDEIIWRGTLEPWPFFDEELHLAAPAMAVPAASYASWAAIAAASRPRGLRWRLRKTLFFGSECR